MRLNTSRTWRAALGCTVLLGAAGIALAADNDWPQWRGPDRSGRAGNFTVPQTWPKQLKQQWKQQVGTGDATPALAGDKVYVFTRQGADEVLQCLDARTGQPAWQDKYPTIEITGGGDRDHPGPRASPTVAEGKVVTFGVAGVLSCYDANSGKMLWRKESSRDFNPAYPTFHTGMSPLIVDGLCVAHLGGGGKGAVIAFDLNSGEPKWRWEGDAPGYGSPVLATIGGTRQIVNAGERLIVGLSPTDGKVLWESPLPAGGGPGMRGGPGGGPGGPPGGGRGGPGGPPPPQTAPPPDGPRGGGRGGPGGPGGGGRGGRGGGMSYTTATPIVEGNMVILSGRGGTRAVSVEKQGDSFTAKELWNNPDVGTAFNTAVVKDGRLYGLSQSNDLFCLDAKTGKALWTHPLQAGGGGAGGGPGGGGRRGGMGGPGGFGSIVDAGSVLLALSPASELVVFKPSDAEYAEVARIKVADSPTFAHPVAVDKRILIKDRDSVTMYTVE